MRVMIIGADGQLGTDLVRTLDGELTPLTHAQIEVSDRASVDAAMAVHRPEVVINTAAYHQVDAAESDPAQAITVNTVGARNVALACAAYDADLCHVSTDYVFGGAVGDRTGCVRHRNRAGRRCVTVDAVYTDAVLDDDLQIWRLVEFLRANAKKTHDDRFGFW